MFYFPSNMGPNQVFWEKATPGNQGPNCQIDKSLRSNCSKKQFKRTTVLKDYTNEGTSSRSGWSQLCQTSKRNQSGEILKRGLLCMWCLLLKPSRLLVKGKLLPLAKASCLSRGDLSISPDMSF
jgi:hypothetical protein